MFSGDYNWVEHTVANGICRRCKQAFAFEGTIYTRPGEILLCEPLPQLKRSVCQSPS